jgi:hypothetical protein
MALIHVAIIIMLFEIRKLIKDLRHILTTGEIRP